MIPAFVAGVILIVYILFRFTMSQAHYKVDVCMDYQGRSNCGTASGSTEQFALQAATTNACATIASGVTETMGCEHASPSSVRWLKRPGN